MKTKNFIRNSIYCHLRLSLRLCKLEQKLPNHDAAELWTEKNSKVYEKVHPFKMCIKSAFCWNFTTPDAFQVLFHLLLLFTSTYGLTKKFQLYSWKAPKTLSCWWSVCAWQISCKRREAMLHEGVKGFQVCRLFYRKFFLSSDKIRQNEWTKK